MSNKQQNGRISSNNSNTDGVVYRGTADPRLRKVSSSGDPHESICRDFVWGICSKGAQCKYRHELSFEVMKRTLKFCHDYQNKSGCTRPGCTYLHISNEEENLFLTSRQIPKILQERYAAMSANSSSNVYINEIIAQGPPPPPPIIPVVGAPVPPLVQAGPLPTLLAPPPPPPPPTVTTVPVQNTPPVFTAPPPFHSTVPVQPTGQPSVELPLFDASKPPPSLPSITSTAPKLTVKRSADSSSEAAPTKLLKEDVPKLEKGPCDTCVHKKLRVDMYQKKEQKIECEMEYQTFKFQKILETYESGRKMLKSKVGPDLFRILDGYIQSAAQQSTSQISEVNSPFNQTTPVALESSSTLQRQFLCSLMELTQNLVDIGPRQSGRENGTEVTVQSFLEMIRNVTRNSERRIEEIGLNKSESEKNSTPAFPIDYPNKPLVPAGSLTTTTSTSVASSVSSTATHKSVVNVQSNTARHSPQNVRSSNHQQPAPSYGPNVPHSPSQVGTHLSNMGSAPVAPPAQPVAPPVRAHGATPPQGKTPQVMSPQVMSPQHLQIQPAHPPQGAPQPLGPAQHRMQIQNGYAMLPSQAMYPQRGAHPQNVPHVGVPPSIYIPYQNSVPPPNRPQYPQYPPTPNKATIIPPHVRTGAPQLSAPRPATTVAPLQNGCLKNSTLPHYYPAER